MLGDCWQISVILVAAVSAVQ